MLGTAQRRRRRRVVSRSAVSSRSPPSWRPLSASSVSCRSATSYDAYVAAMDQGVEGMLRLATDTPDDAPLLIPDVPDTAAFDPSLRHCLADAVLGRLGFVRCCSTCGSPAASCRMSGRLARPWPDIAGDASAALGRHAGHRQRSLPTLLPGMAGLSGRVALAALLTPFTILGLHGAARHDARDAGPPCPAWRLPMPSPWCSTGSLSPS